MLINDASLVTNMERTRLCPTPFAPFERWPQSEIAYGVMCGIAQRYEESGELDPEYMQSILQCGCPNYEQNPDLQLVSFYVDIFRYIKHSLENGHCPNEIASSLVVDSHAFVFRSMCPQLAEPVIKSRLFEMSQSYKDALRGNCRLSIEQQYRAVIEWIGIYVSNLKDVVLNHS